MTTKRGVRRADDLELVLPHADRFDQHDTRAPGVEHAHDVARRAREARRARLGWRAIE